jgi:flagellin-like protein
MEFISRMKKSLRRNLKAVSPVIATIIIVAITIVMSIAVNFWIISVGGAFTRYEKLEFQNAYATVSSNYSQYLLELRLKNTGSADVALEFLFFNGKPLMDCKDLVEIRFNNVTYPKGGIFSVTVGSGDVVVSTVTLVRAYGGTSSEYKPGMSLQITVQTAVGIQYSKVTVLS